MPAGASGVFCQSPNQSALARLQASLKPRFVGLSLGVLRVPFDIMNILLASFAAYVAVLRTLFCYSQNARGAICTRLLTSKLADSLRLSIVSTLT